MTEKKRGRPKGLPKTGGRKPGVANKATRDVREAIALLAQETCDDVRVWLISIEDPAKRLDLWLRMIEYHIPKLGRTEHVGANGESLPAPATIIIQS
jgi:hypothetical protein